MAEEMKQCEKNVIEQIRSHPLFQTYYGRLEQAEQERRFCCHQMNHLLDVARIAYIQNLEQNLGFSKKMIYATALLHDIGKVRQYEEGIPHETASADIAKEILQDVSEDFGQWEQEQILQAIREHRKYKEEMSSFGKLLYSSDKKSRQCFACPAEPECNWSLEKKNMEIGI